MPWQIVIQHLNRLPIFYPSHFQCGEISLSIPWMWSFSLASLSLRYLQPVMTIFLIYADKAALTEFLWSHVWHLLEAVSTFPWSAISSLTSFIFDQNFTSSILIFLFSNWFLIANSFFQLSISVKGYMALSLGDRQCSSTLPSVWELSNRCAVTNYPPTLKKVTQLVTDHNVPLLFT